MMLYLPSNPKRSDHRYKRNHNPRPRNRIKGVRRLGEHDMKSRPEPCLDKHIESKHDSVGTAKGCCDDDGHAFVSVGHVTAEDEANHQDDIAEDVVRYVACSKQ